MCRRRLHPHVLALILSAAFAAAALCALAPARATNPADVQRVQVDLKNGRPGEWVDVPVTPAVAAAVAGALPPPATAPIVPPPPPPPPPLAQTTGPKGWALPLDAQGWVAWPRTAADVCADADAGDDKAPGTSAKPVRTLKRAAALLPHDRPWTLWLRGTFDEALPSTVPNTGSAAAPCLIRGWGPARPTVRRGVYLPGKTGVAVVDLVVDGPRNGTGDGIRFYGSSFTAVEGCLVQGWLNGVVWESGSDTAARPGWLLRRSVICDQSDDVKNNDHAEGVYTHLARGYLAEDLVLDCNGWTPGPAGLGGPPKVRATLFNQNSYTTGQCEDVEVRDVLTANAGSHGWQHRSGGDVTYYVALDCPIGASWGLVSGAGHTRAGGNTGVLSHWVIQGGRDIDPATPRGVGVQLGNARDLTLRDVYLTDGHDSPVAWPVTMERGVQSGVKGQAPKPMPGDVGLLSVQLERVYVTRWRLGAQLSTRPAALAARSCLVPGLAVNAPAPKAPRDVDDYARSIGLADRQALVRAARGQCRARWDPRLTARAICDYVEASYRD